MASVAKRPDGQWRARYRDAAGKERSKHFRRKVDAEQWLLEVRGAVHAGTWTDPKHGRVTVGEWAARWLGTTADLKPKTRAGYESLLRTRVLPTWSDVPLAKVDHLGVAEWVAGMTSEGLSASRARQAYHLLHAMLDAAVRSNYLPRNPSEGVSLPKLPKVDMVFLDHEQLHRLAENAGQDRTLVLLLGYCGLRWGEAAALRVRRVDLLRGRLDVAESLADVNGHLSFGPPKTHQRRYVVVPRFLRDDLAVSLAGKAPDALVFTSPNGSPLRLSNWRRRVFDPAARAAGIVGLTPHGLRHTAASLMIASGATPKAVQSALGHSTVTLSLDRYGHLFGDELDRLADRLDQDRADFLRTAGPSPVVPIAVAGR